MELSVPSEVSSGGSRGSIVGGSGGGYEEGSGRGVVGRDMKRHMAVYSGVGCDSDCSGSGLETEVDAEVEASVLLVASESVEGPGDGGEASRGRA